MSDRPRYKLTVEAMPSSLPAIVRVRKLLKMLLRWLDMKCVEIEEVKPEPSKGSNEDR